MFGSSFYYGKQRVRSRLVAPAGGKRSPSFTAEQHVLAARATFLVAGFHAQQCSTGRHQCGGTRVLLPTGETAGESSDYAVTTLRPALQRAAGR
jgi:hypothetical protein